MYLALPVKTDVLVIHEQIADFVPQVTRSDGAVVQVVKPFSEQVEEFWTIKSRALWLFVDLVVLQRTNDEHRHVEIVLFLRVAIAQQAVGSFFWDCFLPVVLFTFVVVAFFSIFISDFSSDFDLLFNVLIFTQCISLGSPTMMKKLSKETMHSHQSIALAPLRR